MTGLHEVYEVIFPFFTNKHNTYFYRNIRHSQREMTSIIFVWLFLELGVGVQACAVVPNTMNNTVNNTVVPSPECKKVKNN